MYVCHHAHVCAAEAEAGDDDAELDATSSGNTLPQFLFSLDATDEFLKERVMNLPHLVVEGTHNTEEGTAN